MELKLFRNSSGALCRLSKVNRMELCLDCSTCSDNIEHWSYESARRCYWAFDCFDCCFDRRRKFIEFSISGCCLAKCSSDNYNRLTVSDNLEYSIVALVNNIQIWLNRLSFDNIDISFSELETNSVREHIGAYRISVSSLRTIRPNGIAESRGAIHFVETQLFDTF